MKSLDLEGKPRKNVEEEKNVNDEEEEEEEEDFDKNVLNPNEKNFEKVKEETLKLMSDSKYDTAIKNLNEYLSYIDRTKDKSNSNLVVI